MAHLKWKNLVGQEKIKETLAAAFVNNSLGHAYLFSGAAGVGKFQAALEFAFALLCDDDTEAPCYSCDSCRQLQAHAHPDFHCVFPVALQKKHKGSDRRLSEEGWAYLAELTREKIKNPYTFTEPADLPSIPVEWIREVNHAILRGKVKSRHNVAVIIDVDTMNKESANAMLKTLEEPPKDTVIILITERPHAVLPTIRSRCQILRFGYLSTDVIRESLSSRFGLEANDKRLIEAAACADGSLSQAFLLIDNPPYHIINKAALLLQLAGETDGLAAANRLEDLANELGNGKDYHTCEKVLTYIMYIIRIGFFQNLVKTETYIKNDVFSISAPVRELNFDATEKITKECQKAISDIRARGNMMLVLATFLSAITEIINGKKQQPC